MVEFRVSDISDLERLSISNLMTYMKTEFRSGYLKEVENIVYLRVERLKLEKEEEVRVYKDKCSELSNVNVKLEFMKVDLELEAGAEGSNRKPKKDKVEQSKVQTESNGGMPNLKIRGSTLRGTARVLDFSGVDSACHTPVKGSGSGQVEGLSLWIYVICFFFCVVLARTSI